MRCTHSISVRQWEPSHLKMRGGPCKKMCLLPSTPWRHAGTLAAGIVHPPNTRQKEKRIQCACHAIHGGAVHHTCQHPITHQILWSCPSDSLTKFIGFPSRHLKVPFSLFYYKVDLCPCGGTLTVFLLLVNYAVSVRLGPYVCSLCATVTPITIL